MSKSNKATKVESTVEVDMNAIVADIPTTSGKIRALTSHGLKRSEIAKFLGIRYQHVRNVQLQPLKKSA